MRRHLLRSPCLYQRGIREAATPYDWNGICDRDGGQSVSDGNESNRSAYLAITRWPRSAAPPSHLEGWLAHPPLSALVQSALAVSVSGNLSHASGNRCGQCPDPRAAKDRLGHLRY